MKVVLDTNVLVAGFGTRGLCEDVVRVCLSNHQLFISHAILTEVDTHLRGKFKLPAVRVREILSLVRKLGQIVEPLDVPPDACRDRDDLVTLGTAIAASAECLITGDKDLLTLGAYQRIPILDPRAFYDLIK